jgi:mRNA interferase RelE/StbE
VPSSHHHRTDWFGPSINLRGTGTDKPHRGGKPLDEELTGIFSARVARDWRVLYEIDDTKHVVIVLDIGHRSAAYRPRW